MFGKADEKLYILGRNKWYGKVTTSTKQYKIDRRNSHYRAKKSCMLSRKPYLDIKEVKILTKSDVPEDIKMVIKIEFEVKVVENKERLSCLVLN